MLNKSWPYQPSVIENEVQNNMSYFLLCDYSRPSTVLAHCDGILPKGPYSPCLHMADRALLAGYPRNLAVTTGRLGSSIYEWLAWAIWTTYAVSHPIHWLMTDLAIIGDVQEYIDKSGLCGLFCHYTHDLSLVVPQYTCHNMLYQNHSIGISGHGVIIPGGCGSLTLWSNSHYNDWVAWPVSVIHTNHCMVQCGPVYNRVKCLQQNSKRHPI